jgi:hypothetical protein
VSDGPFRRPPRIEADPLGWPRPDEPEPVSAGNGYVGVMPSRCCGSPVWHPPARCTGCGHRCVHLGAHGLFVPATRTLHWRYWAADLAMRVAARFAGAQEGKQG